MKKYYIELADSDSSEPYILQSQWYDKKRDALKFWEQIDFCNCDAYLMSSEWDDEEDCYTDIEQEKRLN